MDIDKFDYQINHQAVVFDVGGYEGEFAAFLRTKFGCGVHIFEPCQEFFVKIKKRFENDPLMWIYPVALGAENKEDVPLFVNSTVTSIHYPSKGAVEETCRVRDIVYFIEAFKLSRIDLLKLNCEGSEYEIMDRLIEKDWLSKVNNLVVQFHKETDKYDEILSKTHTNRHKSLHWAWWSK